MADISFLYDKNKRHSDIQIVNGDFLLCEDRKEDTTTGELIEASSLQVAVELSLFTDRRATTSEIQIFQSGIQERQSRRGFWASTFKEYVQGSALWLLQREKQTAETLSRAKVYCNDSLQWLIDGGVVDSVSTETSYSGDALIIEISITKPDGQTAGFKYQFTWDSLEAIQ